MGSAASAHGVSAAVHASTSEELLSLAVSLTPELRWRLKAAAIERDLVVKVPEATAARGSVALSPLDIACMGRATPMVWFYEETLDDAALLETLQHALASYQVLSGRYDTGPLPTAINLVNAGVPVRICCAPAAVTLADAVKHLPGPSRVAPTYFSTRAHEAYVPAKVGMDPDPCTADAPLLKIQITFFAGGGTAIGQLGMHGAVDASSQIQFFASWARVYCHLPVDPAPDHVRSAATELSAGCPAEELSDLFKSRAVAAGEKAVPEFAPVMPKISGEVVTCVPFPKKQLSTLVEAARAGYPEGARISTDDVLTAHVWKALAVARCEQLGLSLQSEEVLGQVTTCQRAFNVRKRTALGASYFGNGVTQVWSELTIKELCVELNAAQVAQKLRRDLQAVTPEVVARRVQWYKAQQEQGCKTPAIFDQYALTFIVSSWMFDWEAADFHAKPVAYDHGALVPIVCNYTARPDGDGVNVYTTGTQAAVKRCSELLSAHEASIRTAEPAELA